MVEFLIQHFDVWYPATLIGSIALALISLLVLAILDRRRVGDRRDDGEVCWACNGLCAPGDEC